MPFLGHKFKREREWDEVRASAQEDLIALGEDIRALDIDIQMPGVSDEATQRYEQALQAYERASQIFDRATRPEDLAPVSETLEEGRYAMAYAKALVFRASRRLSIGRRASSTHVTVRQPRTSSGRRAAAHGDRFRRAPPTRSGSRTALRLTAGRCRSTVGRPTTGTRPDTTGR